MHYHDPTTVSFRGGVPATFTWRGHIYQILTITDRWSRTATNPADPRARNTAVEPDFWQVEAATQGSPSGTYELRYTPRHKSWHVTAAKERTADHAGHW